MKTFKVPEVKVIYLAPSNILTLSCECDDCQECEEGSNDCTCYDPWTSDSKKGVIKLN